MEQQPDTYSLSPRVLCQNKAEAREPGSDLAAALSSLRDKADEALTAGPFAVTEKTMAPPSGDMHDFLRVPPYWWKNPDTADGFPYVSRDGQINPDFWSDAYDQGRLSTMISTVFTLACGYFFLDDVTCAERAALLLRTWFLNPDTRMNPNLNHSNCIPGVERGSGSGIITCALLHQVIEAVGLIADSHAWTDADRDGMSGWFRAFLTWLRESPEGNLEQKSQNNHGSWFDLQLTSYALFAGEAELAKAVLSSVPEGRIARQIEADGKQPRELTRTRACLSPIVGQAVRRRG